MTARAKKPRRGRPALGNRARTRNVTVKLSEVEIDTIASAADKVGGTVASWLRDHGLAAAR